MASSSIHVNRHILASVDVALNSPFDSDLIVCRVVEVEQFQQSDSTFIADRSIWQQIVNQLATLGVCPAADGGQKASV